MKKQISKISVALIGGALMSSVAVAEVGAIATAGGAVDVVSTANGQAVPAGQLGCEVLASTVRIGVSANVWGAFDCRSGTATTPAVIGVGTCHQAGLIKPATRTCSGVDAPVAGCTAGGTYETPGAVAFTAVTTGGTVGAVPLGAGCTTAATIQAAVTTATNDGLSAATQ